METLQHVDSSEISRKYRELSQYQPKLVSATVPSDGREQKELFLRDSIDNPSHLYPKLNYDDEQFYHLNKASKELLSQVAGDKRQALVYSPFVRRYIEQAKMLRSMHNIKIAQSDEDKVAAKEKFMEYNIGLYGEPDHETYLALLTERVSVIEEKRLTPSSERILDELRTMLPVELIGRRSYEKFEPTRETIEWMSGAVETMYGSLLRHIPDKESFTAHEVQAVFQQVLSEEFAGSGDDWSVDVEEAKSINVKAGEKRIVIPVDRNELSRDALRGLVVHEIGVHVLRSITGSSTDIAPLGHGLDGYYDSEEGLGMAMEQALKGSVSEVAGIDHYITAGAAYYDKKDFRATYELKWRIALLKDLQDDIEPTDEMIAAAKDKAYKGTMRMFRGTDELPWFKDLAYYNGATEIWKFLESIGGDDLQLTLLMMGKINTSPEHQAVILESNSL